MNTVTAEDKVLILDGDTHLGWAEVTNGRWSYSPPRLSAGSHRLTAQYKGLQSSTWIVNVQHNVQHIDRLEGAPNGPFRYIDRPYYIGTVTVNAEPPPGLNYNPGIMHSGISMNIYSLNWSGHVRNATLRLDFKQVYSSVELRGHNDPLHPTRVQAFDKFGQLLQTVTIPVGNNYVTLLAPAQGGIKSIVGYVDAPTPLSGMPACIINTVLMTV
jgi:hypothetical protein